MQRYFRKAVLITYGCRLIIHETSVLVLNFGSLGTPFTELGFGVFVGRVFTKDENPDLHSPQAKIKVKCREIG
jgi:hypothetical protein